MSRHGTRNDVHGRSILFSGQEKCPIVDLIKYVKVIVIRRLNYHILEHGEVGTLLKSQTARIIHIVLEKWRTVIEKRAISQTIFFRLAKMLESRRILVNAHVLPG